MLDMSGFSALEEPLPPFRRGPNETSKFLWTLWDGCSNGFQPTDVAHDEMEPSVFVLGGRFDQRKQVVRSGNIKTAKVTQPGKRLENFSGWQTCLRKDNSIGVNVKPWNVVVPGNGPGNAHMDGIVPIVDRGIGFGGRVPIVVQLAEGDKE